MTRIQSFVAIALGTAIGYGTTVFAQTQLNQRAEYECMKQAKMHRLVTLRSWPIEAKACVHIRYIAN